MILSEIFLEAEISSFDRSPMVAASMEKQQPKTAQLAIYRGEYSGNRGGNFFTPDREFARQFTQSGQDREVKVRYIDPDDVFHPPESFYAGDQDAVEEAVKMARMMGFKAVWLSEQKFGHGEPDSIYVFDRSAIRMRHD